MRDSVNPVTEVSVSALSDRGVRPPGKPVRDTMTSVVSVSALSDRGVRPRPWDTKKPFPRVSVSALSDRGVRRHKESAKLD